MVLYRLLAIKRSGWRHSYLFSSSLRRMQFQGDVGSDAGAEGDLALRDLD